MSIKSCALAPRLKSFTKTILYRSSDKTEQICGYTFSFVLLLNAFLQAEILKSAEEVRVVEKNQELA